MADVAAFQILGPRRRQEDAALHVRHGRGRPARRRRRHGRRACGRTSPAMSAVLGFEKGFGAPPDEAQDNMQWATRFIDGLRGALDAMAEALARGDGADGMATTLAAVWADPDGMRWLSVGDSGIWESDLVGHLCSDPSERSARSGQPGGFRLDGDGWASPGGVDRGGVLRGRD